MSASNKFRVTSECPNLACNGSVYEWLLEKLEEDTATWMNVAILPNMTSTGVTAKNMIIKQKALPSSTKFRLSLVVTSLVGSEGFGVLEFETAGKPYGGECSASVQEGIALETEFTFECQGWEDKNTPLTYEFRAGKDTISYGNSPKSVSTVLPAGHQVDDYKLAIRIYIKNSVGVAVVKILHVKVRSSWYTGIKSFSFLCRQQRIVGQIGSTNCRMSASPDCFTSLSCLLLREYWNLVPNNTNIRVKK